jgi:hypothetical protein
MYEDFFEGMGMCHHGCNALMILMEDGNCHREGLLVCYMT